jgi:hypothetical protein
MISTQIVTGKTKFWYWITESIICADGTVIPRGFLFDGYSVPALLKSLIRRVPSLEPALRHDWDYVSGEKRSVADNRLYRDMVRSGASKYTAFKVWFGVRIGGWIAYNHYRGMDQGCLMEMHIAADRFEAQRKVIALEKMR